MTIIGDDLLDEGASVPRPKQEGSEEEEVPRVSAQPREESEPAEATPDLSNLTFQVVNTLREWYVLASDSIANLLEGRLLQQPAHDLWLLGRYYELGDATGEQAIQGQQAQQPLGSSWVSGYPPAVLKDFSRLIWCTYRSQYPPIAPSAFTTDSGWGCMLRAGQTLLAQAMQLHYFGRDWDFDWNGTAERDVRRRQQYIDIVKQFFDDYSSSSLFSIHRMASFGKQFEGKDIGQWFGPYGTAAIIRELAQRSDHDLSIYTTTDGVVYLADICEPEFKPTLILVATMLGIDRVNPVYYPFIQASLTLPQSAGIAGGRPSSALYFAGFQGDELLYLDPHYTRPAVLQKQNDTYEQADLATYSCSTPRRLALSRLDPCMVFGYYCGTLEALIDLRSRIDLLADDGMTTIMSFDNGNSPEASKAVPVSHDSSSHSQNTDQGTSSTGLLVKLPPSPGSSSGSNGVIVEDDGDNNGSECDAAESHSEDEWVTDI
ncbi:Cysteine protease atg4 [Coemansia erecta]|uniref:Cysteine protease n=1 Tax=Coemansia erecta TaxID=147472 RepID=A0A9W8CRQ6_9FUNG|nr:Cysteine protease atg4 [Coemansia erecta]